MFEADSSHFMLFLISKDTNTFSNYLLLQKYCLYSINFVIKCLILNKKAYWFNISSIFLVNYIYLYHFCLVKPWWVRWKGLKCPLKCRLNKWHVTYKFRKNVEKYFKYGFHFKNIILIFSFKIYTFGKAYSRIIPTLHTTNSISLFIILKF